MIKILCVSVLLSTIAAPGQVSAGPSERVLDENNFFRASAWDLEPGKPATLFDNRRDLIVIALSDIKAANTEKEAFLPIGAGTLRFVAHGSHLFVQSNGAPSPQMIVAALKDHWEAEIRECTDPKKCSHAIRAGDAEIGESTLVLTNGFVTAYQHRLHRGGTLASSYYSSTAADHLLFIALTDLKANFDGQEEKLRVGQVYSSDANQVEMTADNGEARWVVIRMNVPKKSN